MLLHLVYVLVDPISEYNFFFFFHRIFTFTILNLYLIVSIYFSSIQHLLVHLFRNINHSNSQLFVNIILNNACLYIISNFDIRFKISSMKLTHQSLWALVELVSFLNITNVAILLSCSILKFKSFHPAPSTWITSDSNQ